MKIFKRIKGEDKCFSSSPIESIINNSLDLPDKLNTLRESLSTVKLTPNGENELISLLFSKFNGDIYFPRKGDNSERFDALIAFPEYKIVTEVEIPSSAILDAPRNLLDDYAVLHTRREETDVDVIPLVICWDLPNKRTDYWNVITDINEILGVKIKTVSILALALYYWTDSPIDFSNDDFYLDHANPNLYRAIELLRDNGLNESDYPGYFTPFK